MPLGPLGNERLLGRLHLANPEHQPLAHLLPELLEHLRLGLGGEIMLALLLAFHSIGHEARHLGIGQGAGEAHGAGNGVLQGAGQAGLGAVQVQGDLGRGHGAGHRPRQGIEIPGIDGQLVLAMPGHQPLHLLVQQGLLAAIQGEVVVQLPDDGRVEPVVDHPGRAAGQQQAEQQQAPAAGLTP
ncbi:hypothetical protein D3C79_705410 [compost metagenome]